MLETIIKTIYSVVDTLPVAAIQTLLIEGIGNIFIELWDKFSRGRFRRIQFKKTKNLGEDYKKRYYVDSPEFSHQSTNISSTITVRTGSDTNDEPLAYLLGSIFLSVIVSGVFIKNAVIISNVLKRSSVIPIYLCIGLIAKMTFSKRRYKITVKYVVYTLFVSALTLHYGNNLVKLSKIMTSSAANLSLLGESIQIIAGIVIAFFQQIVSFIMLFRVILVFIYYKKSKESKILNKLLFKTQFFENIPMLVILTLLMSGISVYSTKILYNL